MPPGSLWAPFFICEDDLFEMVVPYSQPSSCLKKTYEHELASGIVEGV